MNIQDWFPLGWTGWISLLSKDLSSVFSNTTVQKHWFWDNVKHPNIWIIGVPEEEHKKKDHEKISRW